MQLPIHQIDAFADRTFTGNPAAVVELPQWLPDSILQAIAAENNLSETAFLVREVPRRRRRLDRYRPGVPPALVHPRPRRWSCAVTPRWLPRTCCCRGSTPGQIW